jgi:hypothetical protein
VVWGHRDGSSGERRSSAGRGDRASPIGRQRVSNSSQAGAGLHPGCGEASRDGDKTPQQKLAELQSLYDQKLISASDYEAAKKKILGELTN